MSDDPTPRARAVIFGSQQDRIEQRLDELDPDLGGYIRDFAYDTVYERPGLDLKTKELIACALLVSLGSPPELRTHLRGALNAGATEAELRGALMMCVPYLGFPRTVAAFEVLRHHLGTARPAPDGEAGPDGA
ncbi:carboxymuconolactone decarboxylase family protein [Deinococcus soli (ex Cha et al. 2016)]|uniref:4-carboxymuconolactone decarboxylase n=1 Tax=Deinococcus soli (ex Cha et al. 2016) TaxID=1309411 RepID=A0A0F7JTE8_9DEIO|nr:carboxymuconolactone decarboxylase family protein [Deinococcus soli (ex Cha et al. 2016)]AKH17973.1 4-carboxymuconolactone decarboxylase [Deinococcus soli (ex Cha et al. 2016)]